MQIPQHFIYNATEFISEEWYLNLFKFASSKLMPLTQRLKETIFTYDSTPVTVELEEP